MTALLQHLTRDIPDAAITREDEVACVEFCKSLEAFIENIRARSAKSVTAIDPSQVERKRIADERKRLFGNGKSRY